MLQQDKKNKNDPNVEKDLNTLGADIAAIAETSPEILRKHPLKNQWTLWYFEADPTKSWEDLQNEITSFETVEDFWSLYNHIKLASEIKVGSDYALFKKGIRPMWEDKANENGGHYVIAITRQQRRTDLDAYWLEVLLSLTGEIFENSNEICGAVVNIRAKLDRITIWTTNADKEEAIKEIGCKLKDALNLEPHKLIFRGHGNKRDMPRKRLSEMMAETE